MFASIYSPEPAAFVELISGEEVQIGFVREGGWKRLGFIFAIEAADKAWVGFDVRKISALGAQVFDGVSRAGASRVRAVAEAIRGAFASREALAWALAAEAEPFAVPTTSD